jgi:hypothetical protein
VRKRKPQRENDKGTPALSVCHYNDVRVHGKLKTMPVVASGLTPHRWTIRDLIERTAAH